MNHSLKVEHLIGARKTVIKYIEEVFGTIGAYIESQTEGEFKRRRPASSD
jgi:hypothetical protein